MKILKSTENLSQLLDRNTLELDEIGVKVRAIVADVKKRGDQALFEYTKKFDNLELNESNVALSEEEIDAAYSQVSDELLAALRKAKQNIASFHKRNLRKTAIKNEGGKTTGVLIRPVERAGIYVPGGKAAYPSSVLMCALPAVAAGVKEIIMVTPSTMGINPLVLVAARECGVKKIFKIGGAQAIAALAYGTQTIPKVNVISGPGNIYVTLAKKEVFGQVGIDMLAGPSEILIIADKTADPEFIAADFLSQAEHDELAACVLLTDSKPLIDSVFESINRRLQELPKKEIAQKSIQNNGFLVLTKNLTEAAQISNKIAPEHLELAVKNPQALLKKITNAGAVFLGQYSPEPLGDYFAGPNHVLPTSGTAKFSSALSADNYIKKISIIKYSQDMLFEAKNDIIALAEAEGLEAHAQSVRVRFKK